MSLIQQALKRQQDEAKGKIVLPPPHLGSTQLAVKPQEPVKPPLFAPAPPVMPPVRPTDDYALAPHQNKMKLANSPDQPASASVNLPTLPPPDAQDADSQPQQSAANAEPVPLPPVLVEPPPQKEKSSGLKASRLMILLLIVAFAFYWFYWRPNHSTAVATATGGSATVAKTTATSAANANSGEAVVKHIGPLPDVHDIKTKVDAMKAKVEVEHADRAVMNTGLDTPVVVAPVPVAPPSAAPVVVAPLPEVKPVAVISKAAPVVNTVWPKIQINGVMPREIKSQASAIINGNLVSVGESIDGVTLMEVQERGVKMDYKGEEKFLSIGRH